MHTRNRGRTRGHRPVHNKKHNIKPTATRMTATRKSTHAHAGGDLGAVRLNLLLEHLDAPQKERREIEHLGEQHQHPRGVYCVLVLAHEARAHNHEEREEVECDRRDLHRQETHRNMKQGRAALIMDIKLVL